MKLNFYLENRRKVNKQKKKEKEKEISLFEGTLSKLEKGSAVFVTTDDTIMSLPICLIPKNMGIGNSYTFKIFENIKYESKVKEIYSIQKKYINQ